ncbi:MAG: heavy-metal-associated domain-containing protein [Bryobacteraceae bacterium]
MKLIATMAGVALIAVVAVAKEATTHINVPKMDCGSCAVVVKRAMAKTAGVKNTTIDVDKRLVTVVYEDSQINLAQLQQVIEKSGFEVKAPAKVK